ncbi:UvrD-helicase domain-containing protein [Methanolobus bombayensis]|uniref:UvrD-helicase domain-containing protein n=1 Tax=Methanolobus bombayensis TaxID=38023 RepID=UPI001AE4861F|nr:UvrD-helicase domain-containing protein [Methanolobus bombayensis]MBP1909194.1 superfamily I DNA/RNA helicase [Methanolobus bombayensis]
MKKPNDTKEELDVLLKIPYPFSAEQANAVILCVKYLQLIAGPGAGKTEVMVRRVLYLILCLQVPAELITIIAFTNKNVESIKSTIYKRAESYGDSTLMEKVNRLNIHTIHSLCKKIVQEFAGYGDFDVFPPERELPLLMRKGIDFGIQYLPPLPSKPKPWKWILFLDTVSLIENEMMDFKELKIANPLFMDKMENYYRFLEKHRFMTHSMMTRKAIEYLEREDSIKPDIKYLMVDEYQDINPAQDKLIRLLSKDADLTVVGDPFQTIYQWRGSDRSFFENFSETYPSSITLKLENNYRSRGDIVGFINDVKSTIIFSPDK